MRALRPPRRSPARLYDQRSNLVRRALVSRRAESPPGRRRVWSRLARLARSAARDAPDATACQAQANRSAVPRDHHRRARRGLCMTVERIPITSRDEWLAMRRNDVTASDVAAVCGVDPQRTALQVYAEKIGIFAGRPDEAIMRRGRWLEPAVIEALADLRPEWETRRARVYLRDDTIRIGASPDVVAIDPERDGVGNVQCKVVARPVFLRDWCHDGNGDGPVAVPLAYQLQTLTEAMLMGATWAVVAALVIDTYS